MVFCGIHDHLNLVPGCRFRDALRNEKRTFSWVVARKGKIDTFLIIFENDSRWRNGRLRCACGLIKNVADVRLRGGVLLFVPVKQIGEIVSGHFVRIVRFNFLVFDQNNRIEAIHVKVVIIAHLGMYGRFV